MLTLVIVRNNVTLARDAIRLLAIPSLRSLQVPVTAPDKATTPMYGNKKLRGKTSLFYCYFWLVAFKYCCCHCDRREWCDFFLFRGRPQRRVLNVRNCRGRTADQKEKACRYMRSRITLRSSQVLCPHQTRYPTRVSEYFFTRKFYLC